MDSIQLRNNETDHGTVSGLSQSVCEVGLLFECLKPDFISFENAHVGKNYN